MPSTRSRGRTASGFCFASSSSVVDPSKGMRCVSASYIMTPTEYQSDAGAAGWNAACSGAMYAGVPTRVSSPRLPGSPGRYSPTTPKSRMTTRPMRDTITLDGLRSRCSLPRA